MKLIVSDILQNDENIMICGITEIGVIKGVWKYREPPVLLKSYHVEFSHKEFDVSVEAAEDVYAEIWSDYECVHFCGICEDMDEDVYYVRFADDGLDMVEIPKEHNEIKKGDYMSFNVEYNDLKIYVYL